MVEVRKKPKETSVSLIRRFSSKVRMSGVLVEAKKRQYHQAPLKKRAKKEKAIRRLKKAGKIS
jgi:ribosomal protein S21